MEAKYTKGPWRIHEHGVGFEVECQRGNVIAQAQQVTSLKSDPHHSERKANARLISAAPELLEALQEAMQALEWCVEQGGGPVCEHESGVVCFCKENNAISAARAAIAKALGK